VIPIPDDFEVQTLNTVPKMAEEAKHQAVLVAALRRKWSLIADLSKRPIVFHIPMGGSRDAREAGNLKTQGALAGVPDLGIILPCGEVVWIEMKAESGKVSSVQDLLHRHFSELGHNVIIAFSVFDALAQLRKRLSQ
jgi:hypothetical protein